MTKKDGQYGLSGSVLKWIAILTMLIDHIGASLIEVYLMNAYGNSPWQGFWDLPADTIQFWYTLDRVLRCIGRIAFPIFCFLLVEGFVHTRNRAKYALRLGVFCILSEIPFDLAFKGEVFFWTYQNVFFTLLLAFLGIWGFSKCKERGFGGRLLGISCIGWTAVLAELLHTDYGAFGVCFVAVLYMLYEQKAVRTVMGILLLLLYGGIEVWGSIAFLPICLYNGTRGKQPKYFFYAFYPVHLLLLVLAAHVLIPRIF